MSADDLSAEELFLDEIFEDDAAPEPCTSGPHTEYAHLKLDSTTETMFGRLQVRHPQAFSELAREAAEVVDTVVPIAEAHLGSALTGTLRLDLLPQARVSGVNPTIGLLRHAMIAFDEPSPKLAGLLSYQVGQVLWYRATREADYSGYRRMPDWLREAALLPLMHAWSDRERWLEALAGQISVVARGQLLTSTQMVDFSALSPKQGLVASAQSLLRGQSVGRRTPKWEAGLCALLGERPRLGGVEGLEHLTSLSLTDWEAHFAADLDDWVATLTDRHH
ncbi:MAG: hypothetical protein U5L04_01880 [Trueperaceae bacterium]|nr:hypothetical protein [Trueperaceae bacterium]